MTESAAAAADQRLTVLHNSHDRLVSLTVDLPDPAVEGPSYCSDWTIAQVLSHLGSGAEIFASIVTAVAGGDEPPGPERFQPIWDRWNAKSPQDQARDAITADAEFLASVDALSDTERGAWRADLFGSERGLADLLDLRVGEHALHTWDIAVELDPSATVSPDATEIIVDNLGFIVQRAAQPPADPLTVAITTSSPERGLMLTASREGSSLTEGADSSAAAAIRLPAEALVRLVYGRLDDAHTPTVETTGVALDQLRAVFPGS